MSPACPDTAARPVTVESDIDAAVALMTVRGPWDRPLRHTVMTALGTCLTEHPEAVIIDLAQLYDPASRSAPTWMAMQRTAAVMEPPVQLALCVPPELTLADRLQHLGARRFLPVYAKVRQARVAISGRLPLTERLAVTLRPDPDAPSMARNLVGDACLAWGLPDLLHPGRLVISELVTNAVEHAGTEIITVVVSLRGRCLQLNVSDGSTEPPRLLRRARPRRGQPLDERGRGLQQVDATAAAWGSLPARTGKVVWATLRSAEPPTAPR